ncbi:hypothetical protein VTJ49DRAFT_4714 [Mycothermus thermophilus]|uniref:Uncharacterized protein n=1 Tax=Humicola insolens TaxID=85995 RepID=A0ABR3V4Q9_HUMIN
MNESLDKVGFDAKHLPPPSRPSCRNQHKHEHNVDNGVTKAVGGRNLGPLDGPLD